MPKKTEPKQDTSEATLADVMAKFNAAWEYCQGSWHKRWEDNYNLYNNNRVKIGYEGITDTFVPMTFSTIETMTSALFGSKPKFSYIPPQDKPDQNTDILNGLLDHFWDKDQWSIKVISWGRGFLREGTSVVYLYWDGDHPCMINVPIRDFFIDPTASTLENAKYMGRRYLITKEELKSFEIVDPETGKMMPKYKNIDKIQEGSKGDNTDKQEKDMWYGSTVTKPEDNQVEVIEYWTGDKVISIANRSTVIEDSENYYKEKDRKNGSKYPKGLIPFAGLRDYVDASLFYAKSEVDFIADQQELLNDLTNQNTDSITYTLNQMYTLDPKYSHLLNEIENLPGAVYLTEAGALQPIAQRSVPPEAFNERMNLKNEMRETTASNEIVKGVGQDTTSTATEINAQIAGAGQRMGLKVTQIEDEGFHRLARIVFNMVKLYVTEPMMVRIVGKDGVKWEEFNPKEFEGEYEPRVQLEVSIENQKQQDANIAKEMLGAFLGDPEINQAELKKLVMQRAFNLDPDEVQVLVQDVAEMPMEDPMMPPVDPMMDPNMMPPMDPGLAMEPPTEQQIDSPIIPEGPVEPGITADGQIIVEAVIDPVTGQLVPLDPLMAEAALAGIA